MSHDIDRDILLQCLESAQAGLSTKGIIEQSNCFVLRDGQVATYNDEVCCQGPSGLDKELTAVVQAEKLLEILRHLKDDKIGVTCEEGKLIVRAKGKKAEFIAEQEVFLPIDKVDLPTKWSKLPDEFGDAVAMVQQAAGKDESMFATTCVHIHPQWLEASDNYQVCRWPLKTGFKQSVLVRQSSIRHISQLGMTQFGETASWVHFRNERGLVLSCRRYEEEFPDYSDKLVIAGTPLVLPKGLVEAAGVANIFASESQERNFVEVALRPGRVKVTGVGVTGRYQENKSLNYTGEPLTFCIPAQLLSDLIKRHSECHVNDRFLYADGGTYVYMTAITLPEDLAMAEANATSD